ncbi:MAG TPA: hypothetical protein VLC46_26055 [Thermoanaerobaculia bacterium]|nr:hypothetical protein [Thermoanaerobaculia bacterium]
MSAIAQLKPFHHSVPEIDIRSAVPVVRVAELLRHDPVLTLKQTKEAHVIIEEAWQAGLAGEYLAKAAKVFGVSEQQLAFAPGKETVRYRMDGKTPMIDLPRVRTRNGAKVKSDQRSCVALCIDDTPGIKYSSKVWTRVGPPELDLGCPLDKIRERTRMYRRQANICGDWFYDRFVALTKEVFKNNEPTETGRLEVTTVGLQVRGEPDEDAFDDWLLSNDSPNAENEDLFRFLAAAADLDIDLRDADALGPDCEWKSIPHTVELPSRRSDKASDHIDRYRELASRQFIYLVRKAGNEQSVVGIGFDDSGRGELASDVALKISRFMANRI